jgi:hypothetical protein
MDQPEFEMTLKTHLQHTADSGPTCQRGRAGGTLRGEHMTVGFDDFVREWAALRCTRCENSKLFAFLERKALEQWVPVSDPNAWKAADDALIAARRAS